MLNYQTESLCLCHFQAYTNVMHFSLLLKRIHTQKISNCNGMTWLTERIIFIYIINYVLPELAMDIENIASKILSSFFCQYSFLLFLFTTPVINLKFITFVSLNERKILRLFILHSKWYSEKIKAVLHHTGINTPPTWKQFFIVHRL